jgi:ABC-type glutathione transport system ATPase component
VIDSSPPGPAGSTKTPNGTAVAVHGLVKHFGAVKAVDGITFDIATSEIFGILGPNGSGKTTTIRMLCGLLKPSAGTATVAGADVATSPERVKHSIGYMSQAFGLYGDLTVEENLRFYAACYGIGAAARERIAWALDTMRHPARRPGSSRARCRAATSSAWRWAARCCTGRRCCSSTSPPPAWTRRRGAPSGRSSAGSPPPAPRSS